MRFPIELIRSRHLSRVAVIALVAGLAASCSDNSRFSSNPFSNPFTDGTVGGSQVAYAQPQRQPAYRQAPVNDGSDYSVNTVPASRPIAAQPLPPVGSVAQGSAPPARYGGNRGERPIVTGAISTPAPQIGGFKAGGWTATGGTPVTAAAGENVNTLSNRYGVPSDAIMKVNSLTSRNLSPGQQVIIPVYNAAERTQDAGDTHFVSTDQPYPGDTGGARGSVGEAKIRPVATRPAATVAVAQSSVHIVKPGETLTSIAQAYGTTRPKLAKENGLDEWATVKIGQKLNVHGTMRSAPPAQSAASSDPVTAELADNRPPRDVPVPTRITTARPIAVAPKPVAAPKPVQAAKAQLAPVKAARPPVKTVAAAEVHDRPVKTAAVKPVQTATVKPVTTKPVVQVAKAPTTEVKTKPVQVADAAKASKLKVEKTTKLAAAKPKTQLAKAPQVAQAPSMKLPDDQQAPTSTGTITPAGGNPSASAPVEPAKDANASQSGNPEFRWPVKGRIIQSFGQNSDGINISVPEGTEVKAAEDGVVAYAGSELKGYGNLILIRHANGYVTAYGHAKDLDVKKGDTVKRGQTIATAGQTGNVTSPQVLFEVRKGAAPVDPTKYLSGS
ncbi:peptidoglycan DD-metalloendopeptidase family protein [Labrys okinawensis]|uniref:peptidoglycan DD-metalloendopeptidase family protein n=1 Tax=Labrys okinawensis TaxID=346911 RepID=UPI0039BD62D4